MSDSTLNLVQIFFDTATFDDIERDKKINIEAQLGVIGGTMGLLTGFSIISGIEIIFFIFRSILDNFSFLQSTLSLHISTIYQNISVSQDGEFPQDQENPGCVCGKSKVSESFDVTQEKFNVPQKIFDVPQ